MGNSRVEKNRELMKRIEDKDNKNERERKQLSKSVRKAKKRKPYWW